LKKGSRGSLLHARGDPLASFPSNAAGDTELPGCAPLKPMAFKISSSDSVEKSKFQKVINFLMPFFIHTNPNYYAVLCEKLLKCQPPFIRPVAD
jgi:hypothetical protein